VNSRIPLAPPKIDQIKDATISRPLWSVMIPTYNCSRYLIHAIQSVLLQDPGPDKMQIEVIDDHSTDTDVQKLVQSVGKGRVSYFRQKENLGSLRNFETCLNRAKGYRVHILHGDDLIRPGFYQEIADLFDRFPDAGAAFTGFTNIDANGDPLENSKKLAVQPGILPNWLYRIAKAQRIQPPSIVVKRSVYEQIGSFYAVNYGEDWEMWVRIAAHFPVAYSPRHLGLYRMHNDNISSHSLLTGQSIRDIGHVIALIEHQFPEEKRKKIRTLSKRHCSRYFAHASDKVYHEFHNPEKALDLARRAKAMHLNLTTFYFVLKTQIKIFLRYKYKHAPSGQPYHHATRHWRTFLPQMAMSEKSEQQNRQENQD
jgi:glycosyltransferase involved in cell wall biosynthesis